MDFLQSVAEYYFQKYNGDLSSVRFVFPSHRAGVFFTNQVRSMMDSRPMWGLKIVTINELWAQNTDLRQADNITLLFELYEVYSRVFSDAGQTVKSFDDFMPWGKMFLGDFDDIDKYLVEARQLFINLKEFHDLRDDYGHLSDAQRRAIEEFWGTFSLDRISEHQQTFLGTWQNMLSFYNEFRNSLRAKHLGYAGMISRDVAQAIAAGKADIACAPGERFAFVGFNAITEAERLLMSYLRKSDRADFFWDYADFMLRGNGFETDHGPGRFIRRNIEAFPAPDGFEQPMAAGLPPITVTELSYSSEQPALTADFLTHNYNAAERTAVVLTDESLLLPVLYCLPDNVDKVNVTMGYPLKHSQAYGLLDCLFALQRQCTDNSFYYKAVLAILKHPSVARIASAQAETVAQKINRERLLSVARHELQTCELLALIFQKVNETNDIHHYLTEIYQYIFKHTPPADETALQREFVFSMLKALNRFGDLMASSSLPDFDILTWFKLFRSVAEQQSVDFVGEPVQGLQVMGILETRALDFDNIAILNMNEGVFPKTSAANSFIPYVLRKGFGLPTIEFQDSIFSYYFFRLISRARNVELMYTASDESNCMSRFIFQLIYEYGAQVRRRVAVRSVSSPKIGDMSVQKTEHIMSLLDKFKEPGKAVLSPSSLSMYIDCPMHFYFSKVLNINESDELEEDADARLFGNIFHNVMEHMLKPHCGTAITAEMLDAWSKSDNSLIDSLLYAAFMDEMKIDKTQIKSRNLLIFDIIKQYVRKLLQNEKKTAPFTFIDAEKNVSYVFKCSAGSVNFKGIIDRLHSDSHGIHVADYKTGSGPNKTSHSVFPSVDSLFEPKLHHELKPIFQTLIYCMILTETERPQQPLLPNIIWMTKLFKPDYSSKVTDTEGNQITYADVESDFKNRLAQLVEEIFDPEVPFRRTGHSKNCDYCVFANICGTES